MKDNETKRPPPARVASNGCERGICFLDLIRLARLARYREDRGASWASFQSGYFYLRGCFMNNKTKNTVEFADLIDEGLFQTINNMALVLVLFSAEDQLILKEDEYDLALCAARELLSRSKEDLDHPKDLTSEFQHDMRKEKSGLYRRDQ